MSRNRMKKLKKMTMTMMNEDPTIAIPVDELPPGWEPLIDVGGDLERARLALREHRSPGRKVRLILSGGQYSLWLRTHEQWPFRNGKSSS